MKSFFSLILFFVFVQVSHADSFIIISSPESYVSGQNTRFFGEGDGIKISQIVRTFNLELTVSDPQDSETSFMFTLRTKDGGRMKTGSTKCVRMIHGDTTAEMELDFSTPGRGAETSGTLKIHEVLYAEDGSLKKFSADVLIFENSQESKWTYFEVRIGSEIEHTIDASSFLSPPGPEDLKKLLSE